MRHRWVLVIAFVLAGCGQPTPAQQADAFATIGAGLGPPTALPEPTLTAQERADFQTIAERAASMTKAGQQLQTLGQEIRATAQWKAKVRTAAQVITGGQKTIAGIALSDYYAPLATRVKEVTEGCAKPAETLLAADTDQLDVAAVAAQHDAIERWCVTEMERLRDQVAGLN